METEPDLKIANVRVRESAVLGLAGGIQRRTVVTYYVGPHGPFTDEFSTAEATPARLRAAMATRQAGLRELLTVT